MVKWHKLSHDTNVCFSLLLFTLSCIVDSHTRSWCLRSNRLVFSSVNRCKIIWNLKRQYFYRHNISCLIRMCSIYNHASNLDGQRRVAYDASQLSFISTHLATHATLFLSPHYFLLKISGLWKTRLPYPAILNPLYKTLSLIIYLLIIISIPLNMVS